MSVRRSFHRQRPDGGRCARRHRNGMVLLVVLLLLLALSSITAGMLWVAGTQAFTASARERHARLRLEAEAAAMEAFARWQTPQARHAIGDDWVVRRTADGREETVVRADRLTDALTLLRATRRSTGPGGFAGTVRAALLLRTIQPEELLRAFPAALAVGAATLDSGAVVDAQDALVPPAGGFAATCPGAAIRAFNSLFGTSVPGIVARGGVRRAPSSEVRGQPPVLAAPGLAGPEQAGLGPVPWTVVPDIADHRLGDAMPSAPALFYAPHDVVVNGGVGRGILVVHGDVTFRNAARFQGAVLASGRLVLRDGARIVGAARAGTADIRNATVRYNACAIWRAVLGSPALRSAFRPPGRWWLPDYPAVP